MDVAWKSISSIANLELAWRRINTTKNSSYKRFYRKLFLAYELAISSNLKELSKKLQGSWKPNNPVKYFIPKPAGLHRPISLLDLEDLIVYQAIANYCSDLIRPKRRKLENKVVFSNLLNSPKNVFFLSDWKVSYKKYRDAIKNNFSNGNKWVAHFDISSFYDTISHELLLNKAFPAQSTSDTKQKIAGFLQAWASNDHKHHLAHGIPQGPTSSDFMAELFFLDLDQFMQKNKFCYLRYVDDIRIQGKTEQEVIRVVGELEYKCRSYGLIPQAKKFDIFLAKNSDDAIGSLPSLATHNNSNPFSQNLLDQEFVSSLEGRPLRVGDKSRFRFSLYRSSKSTLILRKVITLLPRHPEHTDAIMHFFSNYEKSKPLEKMCNVLLSNNYPSEYTRGELWQLLARIGNPNNYQHLVSKARKDLGVMRCPTLQWGALSFLLHGYRVGVIRTMPKFSKLPDIIVSQIGEILPADQYLPTGCVKNILTSKSYMLNLTLPSEFIEKKLSIGYLSINMRNIPYQTRNAMKALGLVKRNPKIPGAISDILVDMLGISSWTKWEKLLKKQYKYSLQILTKSNVAKKTNKSEWLRCLNSFNDIILRIIIDAINKNNLASKHITSINKKGELVSVGNLLDSKSPFSVAFPVIADGFRKCNDRRNKLPDSHPYNTKGGANNKYLGLLEQKVLIQDLRLSYEDLINNFNGYF